MNWGPVYSLVAPVVVVDDADGPGAADRRRVLHHGQQLCLAVVCESVANGHRHDVVDVLSGTIDPIHASG